MNNYIKIQIAKKYVVFILFFCTVHYFNAKEDDLLKFYIIPMNYEGHEFKFKVPKTIDRIDSLKCEVYKKNKSEKKTYYYLVRQFSKKDIRVYLFYIKDENNGYICIDNHLILIKIIKLTEEIEIEGFPKNLKISLTIPIAFNN
jgi:hypothetical protein